MKNMSNYDYNIYHLLNSETGRTVRYYFTLAKILYDKKIELYWHNEDCAFACLKTLLVCEKISYDEYNKLHDQLQYLMRLYKGARGLKLGRKDITNE